jgi:hypothetical protein
MAGNFPGLPDNWETSLEKFNKMLEFCTGTSAEFHDPSRKLTKNGAKVMQFHSGSSNMVPLSSALSLKLLLDRPWPDDW